eukprot:383059_1
MANKPSAPNALTITDEEMDLGLDFLNELNEQLSDDIEEDIIDEDHDIKAQYINDNEITDDLAKALDEINDQILNNYKQQIFQYFEVFEVDYNKLNNMRINEFCEEIGDYCDNENMTSQLEKVYNLMKTRIKSENNVESKQKDEDITKDNESDQSHSKIINELRKALDELNDKILNNYKDKMIQYFEIFEVDYNKLNNMGIQQFCEGVSEFFERSNIKSKLETIYNLMIESESKMINDLYKAVNDINDEKLNENKYKIIQYFRNNNIDYNKLKNTPKKEFIDNICVYCENEEIKTSLERLFNVMLLYINDESKQQSETENV